MELSVLVGRKVSEQELTSLERMEAFRTKVQQLTKTPSIKFSIPFEKQTSPAFASFMAHLCNLNPAPIFIWTPRARDCGLFELANVTKLNIAFPFDIYAEGILEMTTTDGADHMLFDFSEEDQGNQLLEVEIYGRNWTNALVPFDLRM